MAVCHLIRRVVCLFAVLIVSGIASAAFAQGVTFNVLHQFPASHGIPTALTRGSDGKLYGIFPGAINPASGGAIFRIEDEIADPLTLTIVHTFSGPEGLNSLDALTLAADGRLYGVTSGGGANGRGTLFRLETDNSITVVHAFTAAELGGNTVGPRSGVVQAGDGAFYGVNPSGGSQNAGMIYRVDSAGVFSVVHSFSGDINGGFPTIRLTLGPDGKLYGVTPMSTSDFFSRKGTIFRHTPGTPGAETLHRFSGASISSSPRGPLTVGSDGNAYGTATRVTIGGITSGLDIIYKVGPSTPFTIVYTLNHSTDGQTVRNQLVEGPDGNLYGTALSLGEFGNGTLFRMSMAGAFEVVRSFDDSEAALNTMLVQQSDGRLLGLGNHGGTHRFFRVATDGTYTNPAKVIPAAPATQAFGRLAEFNGGLIGFTQSGGVHGYGTLYRRAANGDVTVLHSFALADGAGPHDLVVGSDGNVYGTTASGGSSGCGTAFRMSGSYLVTTVHHFTCGDGGIIPGGLVRASDGNVYGFTGASSDSPAPLVFKIDPVAGYSVLRAFPAFETISSLTEGPDGRLYGTQPQAGTGGFGRVFALDLAGVFSVIYEFTDGPDGRSPQGITRGLDGALYGSTFFGVDDTAGALYRLTVDGTFTALHQFTPAEGVAAFHPLTPGPDGSLYGATSSPANLFRLTPGGGFEVLHAFATSTFPGGRLFQASDGILYGAAQQNGPSFIYGLTVPTATTLDVSFSSVIYNGVVPLQATLTTHGRPVLGQTIAFSLRGTPVGTAVTDAFGVATLEAQLTLTSPGLYPGAIEASFAGAGAWQASAGANTLHVAQADTQSSISAAPLTTDVLQPITLTGTVSSLPIGLGSPTGTIEFREGTLVLGSAVLSGSSASISMNGLTPGTHEVTVVYLGDTNFKESTSAPITVTVRSLAVATFTLAFANGPAAVGTRPPISAFVAPLGGGTATGSVQFFDLSTGLLLGTANLVNGVATISPSGLTAGLHLIVARYVGNGTLSPSTSPLILLTVYSGPAPIATSVALASSGTPATFGDPVTFTATVTPASGGTPIGAVVFFADGNLLGSAVVSTTGGAHTASVTTSTLTRGVHVVTALFVPGPGYAASNSLPAVQIVQ